MAIVRRIRRLLEDCDADEEIVIDAYGEKYEIIEWYVVEGKPHLVIEKK